jgi:UDP-glucose 4-epimerase
VLRLTNAVGAPVDVDVDRWTLVATDLARQAVRTGELVLRSSGLQWRDFVALADVCDAVLRAADPGGGIAPGTYNLGTGTPHTVRDVAELVQSSFEAHTGTRLPLQTAPAEPDPPAPYTVAVDRLASAGWRVRSSLADGVDELVRFCIDHQDELR